MLRRSHQFLCLIAIMLVLPASPLESATINVPADNGNGGLPTVDMGVYEYACTGNLNDTADVTLPDFALFGQQWMQTDCDLCSGADFTGDSNVTMEDLLTQIANWLCGA